MRLYCDKVSSRLDYIVDFISCELSISIQITTDQVEFRNEPGPKINYSAQRLTEDEIQIGPSALLFETGLAPQNLSPFHFGGYPAFFKCNNRDFSFDIFAASFYLLSRYEEYLTHEKNDYGCFAHENSLAYKGEFLKLPLINYWIKDLKSSILIKWPLFNFPGRNFRFIPTYDVDSAWRFTGKGFKKNIGSFIKSAFKMDLKSMNRQIAVLQNRQSDPFNAYEWLHSLHETYHLNPFYFLLVAKTQTGRDLNISPSHAGFQKLIRQLSERAEIGIHPSWKSGDVPALLFEEKKILEEITGRPVVNSRQHFIRWHLPDTCRNLIEAGIVNDFSMGYSTINGFRASVASPFFWYDLPNERVSSLRLWPFCFMDSTAIFEQELNEEEAIQELIILYEAIKKVDGLMITVMHNNYVGSDERFAGWIILYEKFLKILGIVS